MIDTQLDKNIQAMRRRFWKQRKEQISQKRPKSHTYRGEEIKLQCGHWIPTPEFLEDIRKQDLRCRTCGMSWRGYNVINRFKGQAKKELYDAMRRGREQRERKK